jgi:hypothetical protein
MIPKAWKERLAKARAELEAKTACQINADRAYGWAALALVAYDNAVNSAGMSSECWLRDADEYAAEAAEHSAVAELGGCRGISTEILTLLMKARKHAT